MKMAKMDVSAYNVFPVLRLRECLIDKYQEFNMGENSATLYYNFIIKCHQGSK